MFFLRKLINTKPKIDNSKQIFLRLPERLKLLLTLAEIRLVISLLGQYYQLKGNGVQNIASIISPDEYIFDELLKKHSNIPLEAVSAIISTQIGNE